MKILVADDHSIVRKGLIQIISSIPQVTLIDEAENGKEVLAKFENGKYELLILDLSMPILNGFDTLKILLNKDPEVKVLILSVYPEHQFAIKTYKLGAYGYLNKNAAPIELKKAIEQILSNKKYLNKKIAEQILFVSEFDKPIQEKLSKREFQIFQYCTEGISSKEIAEKLLISPKTVSTYRTRILQKLQIDNFAQMIYQLNIKEL